MGTRKLLVMALLLVALDSVVLGLAEASRGLGFGLLLTVAVAAVLVGWGLATLGLRGRVASVLACVMGVVGVFLRVGRLGGKLIVLAQESVVLAWGAVRWLWDGPLPDWAPAILALMELWSDVTALLARVHTWVLALSAGRSIFDPVAATLVWGFAVWAVSTWAGWMLRRHSKPLLALAPAGILLAVTLSYSGSGHSVLLVLLGAILLLLACVAYDVQATRWQVSNVAHADLGHEVSVTVVVLSLVLVTVAGLSPSFSIRKVVEYVQSFGSRHADGVEAIAGSLGVELPSEPGVAVLDDLRVAGLPRRHMLGAGPELSRQVVMVISTGDLPPGPPSLILGDDDPPRYYWRSHSYDRYAYWGWYTGETEVTQYAAGEPAITKTLPAQRTVRQEVQIIGDLGGTLYAAGELVAADSSYSIAWRSHRDVFGTAIEAVDYRADSWATEVTEQQMRSAGSEYPEWVRDRYLDLPDDVPQRVLALARDLTATAPTPYDRARAIETYLRGLPYSLDVPAPPTDQDVADYFLFDLQEGYCDYYATAMVVLARAAGLPARLVVGYASGRYNAIAAHYVVTEADAHAWVEVYFPGYQWVEFEPTGGLPAIVRPGETTPLDWPEPQGELSPEVAGRAGLSRLWWLGLPVAIMVLPVLAGAVWMAVEMWWLRRLGPTSAVTALYRNLWRHGRRLAVPMHAGDTPYEFSAAIESWAAALPTEGRPGRMLSSVAQEVRGLADLYVRVSYTLHLPDATEQIQAIKIWQKLRWRLWMARIWLGRRFRRTDLP
jgi:transglutaminase-like putative cysteine protease